MKRDKWIVLSANKYNMSYEETKKRMDEICEEYGIDYKTIHKKSLLNKNDIRISRILRKSGENQQKILDEIYDYSNKTVEEVDAFIEKWDDRTGLKFSYRRILDNKLLTASDEEITKLATDILALNPFLEEMRVKTKVLYVSHQKVSEVQAELDEIKRLIKLTASDRTKQLIVDYLEEVNFDFTGYSDEDKEDLIADMSMMRRVFNYTYVDYIAYNMKDKDLDERVEYLSHNEKIKYQERINSHEMVEIMDSKYLSYRKFQEQYKRTILVIDYSDEGKARFDEFCKTHDAFIYKGLSDSKGKGIKVVKIPEEYNLDEFLAEVLEDSDAGLIEELIKQHDEFAAFNKDSVNTIRILTMNINDNVRFLWPIVRVGRSGQVIDNASAGGIFSAIDPETGVLITDGFDYRGIRYENHPDTGLKFKGHQLPDWEQLKTVVAGLARMIPEVGYIGWDMTYDVNGNWVIVEVNQSPGCRAYQVASGHGIRREYLDLHGIDESEIDNLEGTAVALVVKDALPVRIKRKIRRLLSPIVNAGNTESN